MVGSAPQGLLGRDADLEAIDLLLRGVETPDPDTGPAAQGGTLIFVGEPGIGKTAMLGAAISAARSRNLPLLTAHGSESERHLSFAVLFDLVRPILTHLDSLSPLHRDALSRAFGLMESTTAVEPFFVALAALELVVEAATDQPIVLAVDDAHAVDQPSRDVIAFIARRLSAERAVLFVATRPDPAIQLAAVTSELSITLRTLHALDDATSRELLRLREPGLSPALESVVLRQADGNPLALLELPHALRDAARHEVDLSLDRIPLTDRLVKSFAARLTELDLTTQALLRVVSLNDSNLWSEAAAAVALAVGRQVTLEALTSALDAGLVTCDGSVILFRHPLVRSAVWMATSAPQRAEAHACLAKVMAGDPDRSAWHRACASESPQESIAQSLDAAAQRALSRGAPGTAVQWLEKAAALSPQARRRSQRLLRAAELAFELGRPAMVRRLIAEAQALELGPEERARLGWLEGAFDDGTPGDPDGVRRLVQSSLSARDRGDVDLAVHLLHGAATRCWWGDPGVELRARLLRTVDSLPLDARDPRHLATVSVAGDFDRHQAVLEAVAWWAEQEQVTATQLGGLARAAFVTGDFDRVLAFCAPALTELRRQGRLGSLAQVLVFQTFAAMYTGRWDITRVAADEARRLAEETQQPVWFACAVLGQANLLALHGESERSHDVLKDAERVAVMTGNGAVLNGVLLSRGLAELGRERPADAYANLRRMMTSSDPAFHRTQRAWAVDYLAEAALACGEVDDARAIMDELDVHVAGIPSSGVVRSVSYAHALLAQDDTAESMYAKAYALGAATTPWYRARLDLAHGSWMRRRRQAAASRPYLQSALYTFEALNARAWVARAARELRAGGARETAVIGGPPADLSPQEWQIAQLAAAGLSNRDIGQQLYLSHRTVGSHLYRIFPKLGITSRNQLQTFLQLHGDS